MNHAEHLVLRARLPVLRLRKNKALISRLLFEVSERFQVKIRGKKNKYGFWLRPTWKRIVHWGRDFLNLHRYIFQNQLETLGLISYQPRKRKPLLKLF